MTAGGEGLERRYSLGSSALRALSSKTEMCSDFDTIADTPAERAAFSV
jgi:hypothetical protein